MNERRIVLPGEFLVEGDYQAGLNVFRQGKRFYSSKIGLLSIDKKVVSVIALHGVYEPKIGDLVIGKVIDVGTFSWTIDIRSPYTAILNASDYFKGRFNPLRNSLRDALAPGDMIIAQIVEFDRTRNPVLTVQGHGLGKITKGMVVELTPSKIPRLIGRKGSMINLLKKEGRCQITIGKNGLIHIVGETVKDEELVAQAIEKIEREAHTTGLTDRIMKFLRRSRGLDV
ncbi:RNA-binding protein [Candidatus Bathyarchaeota archaeon]|nr:RNA-binding protein [Candidatus Bathyarchaeota archaeon]